MRMVLKATMVGLMAITLGSLLTPARSGAGCGESSSRQSKSEVITTDVQDITEVNQDMTRLEELGYQLTSSLTDLEYRFSEIINGVEDVRLRNDLESVKWIVTSMRSDMTSYQFLSDRLLSSMGHANVHGNEYTAPTMSKHEEHNH